MATPDCPILFRTAQVAIDKAIKKAKQTFTTTPVVNVVRNTYIDIQSHFTEVKGDAYFVNIFEQKVNPVTGKNELYWPNYDRSVTKSLLRNAALKRRDGAPAAERALAEFELDMWRNTIEPAALSLQEGEALQYLAFKSDNPQDGASFQQISRRGGQLVLESQLLSLNRFQMQMLMEQFNERGDDISVKSENNEVDPTIGWIVKGQAIDIKKDLPQIVDQVGQLSNLKPSLKMLLTFKPQLFQSLPRFDTQDSLSITGLHADIPIIASESLSFWFMATADAQNINEIQIGENITSSSDHEASSVNRVVAEGSKPEVSEVIERGEFHEVVTTSGPGLGVSEIVKPIAISEFTKKVIVGNECKAPVIIKPKLSRQSTKTIFVGFAGSIAEAVKPCLKSESKEVEKLQIPKQEEFKEITKNKKPTKKLLVGGKKTAVVFRAPQKNLRVMTSPANRETPTKKPEKVIFQAKPINEEIPIIQLPALKLLPLKNIPEWIWQGTAAGPDEIIDWQWLSVMIFYALLNTKIEQLKKPAIKIKGNSGEWNQLLEVINP